MTIERSPVESIGLAISLRAEIQQNPDETWTGCIPRLGRQVIVTRDTQEEMLDALVLCQQWLPSYD